MTDLEANPGEAVYCDFCRCQCLQDPANCSDCGAPFNNADAPKHGKCPACYA